MDSGEAEQNLDGLWPSGSMAVFERENCAADHDRHNRQSMKPPRFGYRISIVMSPISRREQRHLSITSMSGICCASNHAVQAG